MDILIFIGGLAIIIYCGVCAVKAAIAIWHEDEEA
jgi:hypothetical protein